MKKLKLKKAKKVTINNVEYYEYTNVNYSLRQKKVEKILSKENIIPYSIEDENERQRIYDFFDSFDFSDIHTRQAVFQPKYSDNSEIASCLSCIQILIRDNKISMFVHVRSQNLFNNFDYDNQTYCIIIKHLSQKLNVEIGKIYVRIASLHFC